MYFSLSNMTDRLSISWKAFMVMTFKAPEEDSKFKAILGQHGFASDMNMGLRNGISPSLELLLLPFTSLLLCLSLHFEMVLPLLHHRINHQGITTMAC